MCETGLTAACQTLTLCLILNKSAVHFSVVTEKLCNVLEVKPEGEGGADVRRCHQKRERIYELNLQGIPGWLYTGNASEEIEGKGRRKLKMADYTVELGIMGVLTKNQEQLIQH